MHLKCISIRKHSRLRFRLIVKHIRSQTFFTLHSRLQFASDGFVTPFPPFPPVRSQQHRCRRHGFLFLECYLLFALRIPLNLLRMRVVCGLGARSPIYKTFAPKRHFISLSDDSTRQTQTHTHTECEFHILSRV